MGESLHYFTLNIKDWNKSVYGHIGICKRDRNTKFFHSRMIQRRKHNQISALKNERGEWIYDEEELQSKASKFFQKLYDEQPKQLMDLPISYFSNLD
ncbi:hypothetical protein J1N35_021802 [Gossypium stocksii]|uniref:Uncharacterized protein n=1 Tax=Gossypium stocksii TaxID=47602 RepID=A0A9D4A0I9_9ROSI|nr:hypothetical protein J1N35_021802 [Gossypium stocksii]